MMLVAYPQANAQGELHVWVGAPGTGAAPAPTFTINGQPAAPTRGAMNAVASSTQDFSGRFVFQLVAAAEYRVEVAAGGQRTEFTTKLVPRDIPDQMEREFQVLLCSCY